MGVSKAADIQLFNVGEDPQRQDDRQCGSTCCFYAQSLRGNFVTTTERPMSRPIYSTS
jgi:hypothetical protein